MAAINTGFSGTPKIAAQITAQPAAINANSFGTVSLTVPGSTVDMNYDVHAPSLEANLFIVGRKCTTAGTVIVLLYNNSGGTITPASQAFNVIAF